MKFVLVNPGFLRGGMAIVFRTPPLGLLSIAGAITEAGEPDVEIVDLSVDRKFPRQLKAIFNRADVVGVSCLTASFMLAKTICDLAKETGVTTLMGGFQPTLMPIVARLPSVDGIVRGEGEITMKEIVTKMRAGDDWRQTDGVSYYDKAADKLIHRPDRELVGDLDELPIPRFDLSDYSKYKSLGFRAGLMETSRGCSFGCNFCCVAKVYGRCWRPKSIERVMEERRLLLEDSKVQWLFNVDDNYVMNPRRAIALSKHIVQDGTTHRNMIIQARADALARNPTMMDWLAKSGVRLVFIGVESLHPRSLKRMNKGINTVNMIKDAIDGLHDRGIAVWASIMTGVEPTPEEAQECLDLTVNFLLQQGVEIMQCTPYTAYPGTGFYDEAVEKGWVKPFDLLKAEMTSLTPERPGFPRAKMRKLVGRAFRRFYLNPRYFFKPSKWAHFLHRDWFWLYKVIFSFTRVGMKEFFIPAILSKNLWKDQQLRDLTPEEPLPVDDSVTVREDILYSD